MASILYEEMINDFHCIIYGHTCTAVQTKGIYLKIPNLVEDIRGGYMANHNLSFLDSDREYFCENVTNIVQWDTNPEWCKIILRKAATMIARMAGFTYNPALEIVKCPVLKSKLRKNHLTRE